MTNPDIELSAEQLAEWEKAALSGAPGLAQEAIPRLVLEVNRLVVERNEKVEKLAREKEYARYSSDSDDGWRQRAVDADLQSGVIGLRGENAYLKAQIDRLSAQLKALGVEPVPYGPSRATRLERVVMVAVRFARAWRR